jgi:tRNA1Val (adenine37-N6)-methyltransferase
VANTYFQFKQFIVHQEHTAMKVCTDACLFGAWVANENNIQTAKTLLDIGTGTGLLSLMVAQAIANKDTKATITALEIEPSAAAEATNNIHKSPWGKHIQVVQEALQNFNCGAESMDCIFTNPPFFEGDLQSNNENKNLAAHSTALPWTTLIQKISNLLKTGGYYYVLIPALRAYTMQKLATQGGLQLVEEVVVFNAEKQKPFRVLQKFVKSTVPNTEIKRSNFIIKYADNNYTEDFIQLLAPYYLHL